MRTFLRLSSPLCLFLVLFAGILSAQQAVSNEYHLIKRTTLGGDGFWDYLTVDAAARRLYLSHGSQVLVLNADTHEQIATIAGKGIHGVTLTDSILHRGYVTNGAANSVTVFDTKTFATMGEIKVGKSPDAALYDPFTKRLIVFNAEGDNATVIDPVKNKVLGKIALGGAPEAGVSDGKGTVFVNLEDKSQIVAFNPKTLKILRRMPLAPGEEPTGLAMDVNKGLLFSVCHNQLMMVMDARSGKIIAQLPIGERVDGVVFDQDRGLAISSNGEGTLTVVREISAMKFEVSQTVTTEAGARTIALDSGTHHVFTATAVYGEKPSPTADNPNPRRKILPGTFSVLEYGE